MKIAIVQFPGSNCERETILAVKRAGMEPVEFLWNESCDKLNDMDGYVIVGGFSYEDRSRAGIIAALDPVMQAIKQQSEQGKPVLGICNGAQILVETGLVPGLENQKLGMVLTENKRMAGDKILGTGFYNAWVHIQLSANYQRNAFTRRLTPQSVMHIPVAHGEGRFVMSDALLQEIQGQGLNVFQYCDASGQCSEDFPVNPNGSRASIAAVSNKAGNVMAIMPHPERTPNGDAIFLSMHDYIRAGHREQVAPMSYYPRRVTTPMYQKPAKSHECLVELVITDNQALTVQNTLRQLALPVTVKRFVHWEIHGDQADVVEQVKKTGLLYNPRKEAEVTLAKNTPQISATLLVRSKEDIYGRQKLQTLQDHFNVNNVTAIHHGVVWQFSGDLDMSQQDLLDRILQTHIISNPYAHDCYQYTTVSS